jgi:hypothetical protein
VDADRLIVGRCYAFRDKPRALSPLLKVRVLDGPARKGKVRIRFEGGDHHGLAEYANTRQLVALWSEHAQLLRDEARATCLKEHADEVADAALATAVMAVVESSGESSICVRPSITAIAETELERICDRAGVSPAPRALHPLAFRDRRGSVHLPLDAMAKLARAFAAAEPTTVIAYLDDQEDELRLRGNAPGERWCHGYLRELSPGFALARRWAGIASEVGALRAEIARLRMLLASAAALLESGGAPRSARRLMRALDGL